jgi:hypothetical protein
MLNSPNEPLPGQPILAADAAAALRYARSATLRKGARTMVTGGAGGQSVRNVRRYTLQPLYMPTASTPAWPFKLYKVINSSGAYIQVNGGDGSVATLSPFAASPDGIATVSGTRNDTQTGSPPAYPLLPVTENGDVYVYAALNSSGQVTSCEVLIGTTPEPDAATPPTYAAKLLGTITAYSAGSGDTPPSFTLADATGPVGITTVGVCGNTVTIT